MLDLLQFYVSGVWVWLGITTGLYLILFSLILIVSKLVCRRNE